MDNRIVLDICKDLDIEAKSHSNSVSEEDAARIRAVAASKVRVNTSADRKPVSSPGGSDRQPNVPTAPKQPQIVRMPAERPNATAKSPQLSGPPKPPTAPKQPTAAKPPGTKIEGASVKPSGGSNNNGSETAKPPTAGTPNQPKTPPSTPRQPAAATSPKPPAAPRQPKVQNSDAKPGGNNSKPENKAERPPAAPKPQLTTPPPRPVSSKPPSSGGKLPPTGDRSNNGDRQNNGDRSNNRSSEERTEARVRTPKPAEVPVPALQTPAPRPSKPAAAKGQGVGSPNKPSEPGAKPVKLVTPRPVKPGEGGNSRDRGDRPERGDRPSRGSVAAVAAVPELQRPPSRPPAESRKGDDSIETLELKLKRPTPPGKATPKKGGKGWSREDDIESEKLKAAAKAAGKTKRKGSVVDEDDDDDLDSYLNDALALADVSDSIARPPKPTTAKPTSAPIQVRRKPVRGGGSSESRQDRRREDRSNVKEKPEFITLTGSLSVRDLAELLAVPDTEIVKQLFFKGIAVSVNQILDVETATMVAESMEILVETAALQAEATKVTEMIDADDLENLHHRPPIVTIMGHVDHGKTTLLDAIRETKVAQGEAGGITQHIGAYHVDVDKDGATQQVVFLDTPGHEAFTAMRARGARVTDIAILVVAADDGVRPQTIEAIRHAQAAGVPIIVAINKVDKIDAQPDRVRQELTEFGLLDEAWGGETIMVPVSALKGENLDLLLENILLVAEIEELSANPARLAKGTVIEAHLDKAKGPVATLIVQNGTLRVGDTLVAGHVFGKVRAMVDDRLQRVDAATPSFAVEVLGLSDVPSAGEEFEVYPEKEARALADTRSEQFRQSRLQQMMASRRVTLNTLSAQAQEGDLKELNLILKADVQGSVEAILGSFQQLPQEEVQVRVLMSAPGEVTETDVDLAAASGAVIVGFNTSLATGSRAAAEAAGVDIRQYDIIYKLLDDIQGAMEGLLEPELVEESLGVVEVRAVFPVGRGAVAGCYVLSGKAIRNCRIRVRRGSDVLYEGYLDSLKRVKEDVKEVNSGFECGIRLDKFNDWQLSDTIETFQMVTKRRTLAAR